MSRNCSDSDSVKPALARLMTTIVHSTQIEKPRFSAKIERIRFFLAIFLPVLSQNASSSGSQSSIQRPLRPDRGAGGASAGLSIVVLRVRPPRKLRKRNAARFQPAVSGAVGELCRLREPRVAGVRQRERTARTKTSAERAEAVAPVTGERDAHPVERRPAQSDARREAPAPALTAMRATVCMARSSPCAR